MDNPRFFDDENIPQAQDEDIDYNDHNTANTSRVDEPSFTMPGSTEKEPKSTLLLRQKVKRKKVTAL